MAWRGFRVNGEANAIDSVCCAVLQLLESASRPSLFNNIETSLNSTRSNPPITWFQLRIQNLPEYSIAQPVEFALNDILKPSDNNDTNHSITFGMFHLDTHVSGRKFQASETSHRHPHSFL